MELAEKLILLYQRETGILDPDSMHLFFDAVTDTAFGKEKPEVKSKIAGVLRKFMSEDLLGKRLNFIKEHGIKSLSRRDGVISTDFLLDLGDCCLFITGMNPRALQYARDYRGINYFTNYGISSYAAAIDTPGASQRRELIGTFADNFESYSRRLREVSQAPPIRFK